MGYTIRKALLEGLPQLPYRKGKGQYEGVVCHSTASLEASDENELKYFQNNWKSRQAFPHFFVDWDSITQTADWQFKCWASGNGNSRYVQIELCETKDKAKFDASYKRYVYLISYFLAQHKLGVEDGVTVVSHDWVSKNLGGTNHVDPIAYLKSHGITWTQHVENVKKEYDMQIGKK